MCIIDRYPPACVTLATQYGDAFYDALNQFAGVLSASTTVNAVSYTHLRAHETVLDLVCRLLLEKKKKQKQYQILRSHHYNNNNTNQNTIQCEHNYNTTMAQYVRLRVRQSS